MLDETLSSEERSRDGSEITLHCMEAVEAGGRVIIKKGAAVTGKIVDVVPSGSRRKPVIGFVIQKIEAVDGSTIKLSSDRFRNFSDDNDKAVYYQKGQSFTVRLGRGRVN